MTVGPDGRRLGGARGAQGNGDEADTELHESDTELANIRLDSSKHGLAMMVDPEDVGWGPPGPKLIRISQRPTGYEETPRLGISPIRFGAAAP